jgi:hypothetical protein
MSLTFIVGEGDSFLYRRKGGRGEERRWKMRCVRETQRGGARRKDDVALVVIQTISSYLQEKLLGLNR